MVTVKICGLTSMTDAAVAVDAGADYLGFVFFPASLRCVPAEATAWIRAITGVAKVGVFRDQQREEIERVRSLADLELVQLHGEEPPELCAALGGATRVIKAIPVADRLDWGRIMAYADVARLLFDTASPGGGGTGVAFDWELLRDRPPELGFWLAGGLDAGNVSAALRAVRPAGVDVASGVEAAVGIKDPGKIQAFVQAVKNTQVLLGRGSAVGAAAGQGWAGKKAPGRQKGNRVR